jgi:hypothetical protein
MASMSMLAIAGISQASGASTPEQPGITTSAPGYGEFNQTGSTPETVESNAGTQPDEVSSETHALSVPDQYNEANRFIGNYQYVSSLNKPIVLPKGIKDPTVADETREAAELDAVVSVLDPSSFTPNSASMKLLSNLRDPQVKTEAAQLLIDNVFEDALLELTNDDENGDLGSDKATLTELVETYPSLSEGLEADLASYTALTNKTNKELSNPNDTNQWNTDNDTLTSDWSNADDADLAEWSMLNSASNAATAFIFDHSPKAQAAAKKTEDNYLTSLQDCNAEVSIGEDECAANIAVAAANNDDLTTFAHWAPMVKGPKSSELKVQTAAANEAVYAAQNEDQDTYDEWAPYVSNQKQQDRMESAVTTEAESDLQDGYSDSAIAWSSEVKPTDSKDRLRFDKDLLKDAESDVNEGYSDLAQQDAAAIYNPALKAQAEKLAQS